MRALIFLDFDGVLTNLETKYNRAHPDCVTRLNRIVEATGAAIVVSSAWRGHPKLCQIMQEWGVQGEVVGITPRLESFDGDLWRSVERGHEIQRWLDEHPGEWNVLILDDDADMAHLCHRLVRTDSHLGLRDQDVDRALVLLGK